MNKPDLLQSSTRVLIVDDSREYAQILRRVLESDFGFTDITWLPDVQAARNLLKNPKHGIRLAFVDYAFPSGDTGGDLLQSIAADGVMNDMVAFLITSEPTPERLKLAQTAGAYGLISKPFSRETLRAQIGRAALLVSAST